MDTGAFVVSLVSQLVIGALLGFMVFLVFSAIESAGSLIDLFAGFQMSQAFDPLMKVNGAQMTRLMQMVALGLLFVSGGAELVLGGPVPHLQRAAGHRVPRAGRGAAAAARHRADVRRGGADRRADRRRAVPRRHRPRRADPRRPALNAFSLGFVLKILITLLAGGTIFIALPQIVEALLEDALQAMGAPIS